MALDVYHQVLVRVREAAEGRTNRPVNLREAARKDGLHGAMETVHEYLTRQGWVADAMGNDMVLITPWGLEETERTLGGDPRGSGEAREAKALAESARDLAELLVRRVDAIAAGRSGSAAELLAEARRAAEGVRAALAAVGAPAREAAAPTPAPAAQNETPKKPAGKR